MAIKPSSPRNGIPRAAVSDATSTPANPPLPRGALVGLHDARHHAHAHGGGKATHQMAHAALLSLSDDLPKLPAKFDPEKMYRVRLKHTILGADGMTYLRPSNDVTMRGDFAETKREAIAGADVIE